MTRENAGYVERMEEEEGGGEGEASNQIKDGSGGGGDKPKPPDQSEETTDDMEPTNTEMTSATLRETSPQKVEEGNENTGKPQEMEERNEVALSTRESKESADTCKSQKAVPDDEGEKSQQPEEASDDTFKKPVFISKLQRQTNKSKESKNLEEKSADQDPAPGTNAGMSKSPAQQLVEKSVPLPYKVRLNLVPVWGENVLQYP